MATRSRSSSLLSFRSLLLLSVVLPLVHLLNLSGQVSSASASTSHDGSTALPVSNHSKTNDTSTLIASSSENKEQQEVASSNTLMPVRYTMSPLTTTMRIHNTDGKAGGIQVFVVTAPAHEKYRDRFLANAEGWHHEFPDLQVYTFDEVPTNVTSLHSYLSRMRQIQMLPFEMNEQRNNLLLASFGAIYKHNPNADWYLLAEDDTIIVKQNMDQLVAGMSPTRDIYMGKCVRVAPSKRFGELYFIMGGSGVLMSGSLLSKMAPGIDDCRKKLAKFEHGDTRISACLKTMDIMPEKICGLQEMEGYKFTSSSAWRESTLPRNRRHLVLTMHEKEPNRIRILNDAIHDLGRLNKAVRWKTLRSYLEKTASNISVAGTAT